MNPSQIRRCMIELEEIWSKNAEEKESSVEILQGCKNSQPANFAGCEHLIRLCQVGVRNQQNLYPRIPTIDVAKLLQYSDYRVEHGDGFSS